MAASWQARAVLMAMPLLVGQRARARCAAAPDVARVLEFAQRADDEISCARLYARAAPAIEKNHIALRERHFHVLLFSADDLQIGARHGIGDIAGAINVRAPGDRVDLIGGRRLRGDRQREWHEEYSRQNGDTSDDSHGDSFEFAGSEMSRTPGADRNCATAGKVPERRRQVNNKYRAATPMRRRHQSDAVFVKARR